MKLSIIIPAKNEEKRLPASLASLCRHITKKTGLSEKEVEIIVVVNNTTDQTYNIVKIFQSHFKFIRVFNIPQAIGKGGAIKFGFEKAHGDYIAFIDADGASPSYELFRLYDNLKDSHADLAIANRYSKESTILRSLPSSRKFFSKCFRLTTKMLFGIKYKDTQCGLKVFRKDVGKYLMMNNDVKGWTFDLNIMLMARLLKLKVLDIPTVWEYKAESTLNIKKALRTVTLELISSFIKYRLGMNKSKLTGIFSESRL